MCPLPGPSCLKRSPRVQETVLGSGLASTSSTSSFLLGATFNVRIKLVLSSECSSPDVSNTCTPSTVYDRITRSPFRYSPLYCPHLCGSGHTPGFPVVRFGFVLRRGVARARVFEAAVMSPAGHHRRAEGLVSGHLRPGLVRAIERRRYASRYRHWSTPRSSAAGRCRTSHTPGVILLTR